MTQSETMMIEALALIAAVAEKMESAPAEQAQQALEELGEFAALTVRVAQEEMQGAA